MKDGTASKTMQSGTLDIPRICEAIRPLRVGRTIRYLDTTSSTNDEAWHGAEDDSADGLVVFTEYQTAGRGRAGRPWHAPRGASVLCSLLLIDKVVALTPGLLTMAAPMAVHDSITATTGLTPRIKWPNDLQLAGRKVAGILIETRTRLDGTPVHVVGIGINCLQRPGHFPRELGNRAVSLDMLSTEPIDRTAVAAALLVQLDRFFAWPEKLDQADLREQWLKRSEAVGGRVRLKHRGKTYEGTVLDLDPTAALVVQLDRGGVRLFEPSDTTVEPVDDAGMRPGGSPE
jgi:BirA family biotin operon repressor/biotin-[acetyl-CoA-carboxylase] ligase